MNKSFLIAQSAGYLLGECLGGAKVTTSYSHDHNDFIWELSGYPLYGTRGTRQGVHRLPGQDLRCSRRRGEV